MDVSRAILGLHGFIAVISDLLNPQRPGSLHSPFRTLDLAQRPWRCGADWRACVSIHSRYGQTFGLIFKSKKWIAVASVLEGQIMLVGGGGRTAGGANVSYCQDGNLVNEVCANEIGVFDFERLVAGVYDLTVEVDQKCVVVPELEI